MLLLDVDVLVWVELEDDELVVLVSLTVVVVVRHSETGTWFTKIPPFTRQSAFTSDWDQATRSHCRWEHTRSTDPAHGPRGRTQGTRCTSWHDLRICEPNLEFQICMPQGHHVIGIHQKHSCDLSPLFMIAVPSVLKSTNSFLQSYGYESQSSFLCQTSLLHQWMSKTCWIFSG